MQQILGHPFTNGKSQGTQRAKALGWGLLLQAVFESPLVNTSGAAGHAILVKGLVRLA